MQEARLGVAMADLNAAQAQLDEKEAELAVVRAMYDKAMAEKQVQLEAETGSPHTPPFCFMYTSDHSLSPTPPFLFVYMSDHSLPPTPPFLFMYRRVFWKYGLLLKVPDLLFVKEREMKNTAFPLFGEGKQGFC